MANGIKVVFIWLLFVSSTTLFASTDTLYIHSLVPVQIFHNKFSHVIKEGDFLTIPANQPFSVQIGGIPIQKPLSNELLVIVSDTEILKYGIVGSASEDQLSKNEFSSYWKAVRQKSKSVWLKHLNDFSKGVLERPSLLAIQSIVKNEKMLLFDQAYLQKNYIAATEILLSLSDSKDWDTSLKDFRFQLAAYFDQSAKIELSEGRYETALTLVTKANDLIPSNERKVLLDSIREERKRITYNQIIIGANALEKTARIKALALYEEAYTYYESDSLKGKVNTLRSVVEDSIYNNAKTRDHNRTMIQYRIMEYENYLQQYPNGKYSTDATSRMLKLSKISGQLERNFVTYGRIFWNDARQGHQIRIGRFSERNIFSLAFTFSDDVFLLRQQPYRVDKDFEIIKANYRLAEVPGKSYNEAHFVTRGNYMVSYARLVGKPRFFQYYVLAEVGISDRYAYYLTYDLGPSILMGAPEENPKYRRYTSEDAVGYAAGLSILFNYKILTVETGARIDYFGYGYIFGIGLSF
jgi:tetratricopeptide (TPR) repeat protein